MSYDLEIKELYFNFTSNLAEFFHTFLEHGEETGLQALNGKSGKEAAIIIARALRAIAVDSGLRPQGVPTWKYFSDKYDPENYWGDVMGATLFLANIYTASINNKANKWSVSC